MDDKFYRRITSESKRERINRLNGMIVASCAKCGAGFTSKRNQRSHFCVEPKKDKVEAHQKEAGE